MRGVGCRNERQRPPWRHPHTHRGESSDDDDDDHRKAAVHRPNYTASSPDVDVSALAPACPTLASLGERLRRPPPLFYSEVLADTRRANLPWRTAYAARDAPLHVPVSHWRPSAAPRTQTATNGWEGMSTTPPQEEQANDAPAVRRVGSDDASHSLAMVEHYHVLELEEQLQYWRQRALQMEGCSLKRERVIKEKFAADFAAAQATSEAVIRQLLDKQQRVLARRQPQASASSSFSSVSSAASSRGRRRNSSDNDGNHAQLDELRRRVGELTKRNAALSASLAAAQHAVKETTAAVAASTRTPSAEDAPSHNAETYDDDECDTPARIQLCVVDVVQALLRCLEHVAELRRCCDAAVNTDGLGHPQEEGVSCDAQPEDEQHRHFTRLLLQSLSSSRQVGHRGYSTAVASARREPLVQQLARLCDAMGYLDDLLLTCVDDVVVVGSRVRDEWQQEQQQDARSTHASLHALPPRAEGHGSDQSAQRVSVAQQTTRHDAAATTAEALLKQQQEDNEAALQAQERLLRRSTQAHAAELEQVRDELAQEMMKAARRVSAAEHDCALHAEREAQWRSRVETAEVARDACAQECAVLRHRLEVRQLRGPSFERQSMAAKEEREKGSQNEHHRLADASLLPTRTESTAAAPRRPWTGQPATSEGGSVSGGVGSSARVATTAASPATLEALLHGNNNSGDAPPSPVPERALCSTEDGAHSSNAAPSVEAIAAAVGTGTRDAPVDVATPRRSLSYSPLENAEKPGSIQEVASHARAVDTNDPVMRETAVVGDKGFPMHVVQPSLLADDAAQRRNGAGVSAQQRVRRSASRTPHVVSPSESSSPLARMRAWEERFKSLLTPA
ncbi:hypothetical protein ABB37_08797 [Leptomonas pyrrhocoris]|uniref:Uncharacterized protein n=1 Tax=Leptomonas pyrrhocoris TaxID=157538 RepID=A0A0N1J4C2_LEPPY|nr:hypothetical protein ABB37_08797 [Leptomonas pyrrhocoris]KPA75132.1 hypothetical protein ABB37_08797 [Leptomonas pyrrhocoris]|eukprot:XP_015653571.1 hypothetical protein ABB37_08797 [Leptomonas pyrrhocoris]